ncbi:uncharacterized protein EDB91DRAFT_1178110 [Suillus paluster]|uniref:uncharacterized protein n=1 Tax=Suillus paluster TaxID=48578 RepID=UPI001B873B69|nr:uncharacterized protein EDB91DRAFT_1178110 [Suillus paluster]KAG1720349.1 hypothetical protein EDB91DRAFT_1178110 [Suillus paluster]
MFTSRSIMFALLSFLTGASACIQCPSTLQVDGSTSYLGETSNLTDEVTYCEYSNAKLIGSDSAVACRYYTKTGQIEDGYHSCPATVSVNGKC